ncbi:MAG: hypothetical protein NDI67_03145 [Sulfuritalea sp.]|nr:hypothetical protein [Sulfuritalea sp.]
MTTIYNHSYSAVFLPRLCRGKPSASDIQEIMWWKCEVQFFRAVLRLKVWARSEPEARSKIERMYQVATIQRLAPADTGPEDFSACLAKPTQNLPPYLVLKP